MNRTIALVMLVATVSASVACNKDKNNAPPGAAPVASFAPVTQDVLPSQAEEERKASAEITPDNYKAQLDQIEKEIDQP